MSLRGFPWNPLWGIPQDILIVLMNALESLRNPFESFRDPLQVPFNAFGESLSPSAIPQSPLFPAENFKFLRGIPQTTLGELVMNLSEFLEVESLRRILESLKEII